MALFRRMSLAADDQVNIQGSQVLVVKPWTIFPVTAGTATDSMRLRKSGIVAG
jgi:hypothetical protein